MAQADVWEWERGQVGHLLLYGARPDSELLHRVKRPGMMTRFSMQTFSSILLRHIMDLFFLLCTMRVSGVSFAGATRYFSYW